MEFEEEKKNYLALLSVWSASQFPWVLHICQAWHWSCQCRWSWRRSARRAPRCTCSRARGSASRWSASDCGDEVGGVSNSNSGRCWCQAKEKRAGEQPSKNKAGANIMFALLSANKLCRFMIHCNIEAFLWHVHHECFRQQSTGAWFNMLASSQLCNGCLHCGGVQGGCYTQVGCSKYVLGENLTSVLKVRSNILCAFVTLPWQGQPSSRRRHSSSMHISVCKNEIKINFKKKCSHYLMRKKKSN